MTSRMSSSRRDAADKIHSASIHILRRVAREDAASGVSPGRLSALAVLVFGGPKTLGELAAAEHVRPPTMTKIVRGLEEEGLVRRERDSSDGRVSRVHPTAKGNRVVQRARERRIATLAARLAHLSEDEVRRVHEAAELVERALAQQP
jgi:DNA-binding MarR family transcriptional regulator